MEKPEERALYQVVIDDLLGRIRAGDFTYEQPLCTERSIAERYGVSRITAKRAITELEAQGLLYRIRGRGSFVDRAFFERAAQQDAGIRVYALVLPFDISKGGLLRTMQVLNERLNREGGYACLYITDLDLNREREILRGLSTQNIAGLAYYPLSDRMNQDVLDAFIMRNIPVVVIDKTTACPYLHGVVSDNEAGGAALTEHLIGLGHTRIAFLSRFSTSEISTIRDRFGGYMRALRAAGLPIDPALVVTRCRREGSVELSELEPLPTLQTCLRELLAAGATAVVCENDDVAFAVIQALRGLGVPVPGRMSVVGFDDTDYATLSEPHITTARQDFTAIGEHIADIFLSGGDGQVHKIVVPVSLVARASSAGAGSEACSGGSIGSRAMR